jgi:hypothetical protein
VVVSLGLQLTPTYSINARPADADHLGDGGLPFKRHPASVRDADKLNRECGTTLLNGLGRDSCELGEHKAGKHLGGAAAR